MTLNIEMTYIKWLLITAQRGLHHGAEDLWEASAGMRGCRGSLRLPLAPGERDGNVEPKLFIFEVFLTMQFWCNESVNYQWMI